MNGITLEDVSVWQGKTNILQHLHCKLEMGEFILLTGDTGSGKSTLFQFLSGIKPMIFEGQCHLLGKDISSMTPVERATIAGTVFQKAYRQFTMKNLRSELTFTLENLGFNYEQIQKRIHHVTMDTVTQHLLDRPFVQLSGGEQQRSAIAVLLAMDVPILLLDEPFASVDEKSRRSLMKLLFELSQKGKLVIVIDHDTNGYNEYVSRVLHIQKGCLQTVPISTLSNHAVIPLEQEGASTEKFFTFQNVIKEGLWSIPEFSLEKGITTLTGDNGVGKSTLLRAMVQLSKVKGNFMYEGQKITKRNRSKLLTLIVQEAMHQFVTLMPRDELNFGMKRFAQAHKWQERILAETPLGSKLDTSLMYLSGGEQKLIQLICMLSLEIPFLLLDEPFTGLDKKSCQLIGEWMKWNQQTHDQQLLVVSHRLAPLEGVSQHHIQITEQTLQKGGIQYGKTV